LDTGHKLVGFNYLDLCHLMLRSPLLLQDISRKGGSMCL
jgi:hypothetical protein